MFRQFDRTLFRKGLVSANRRRQYLKSLSGNKSDPLETCLNFSTAREPIVQKRYNTCLRGVSKRLYTTVSNEQSNKVRSLDNVRDELFKVKPQWFSKLMTKQQATPIYSTFQLLALNNRKLLNQIEINSNLQHFLSYLASQTNRNSLGESDECKENAMKISFKSLKGSNSIESAFTLLVHTILKAQFPSYNNSTVDDLLRESIRKYNLQPSNLFISKELAHDSVFGSDFDRIVNDERFQIAVQILKIRLNENKGWKANHESRDDNIITWINSLFEPSINKCLLMLTKTKFVPEIILYDLLLRNPTSELEYKYFFEFYRSFSTELNLIDQEKLYHFKQFDMKFDRNLIIPAMFNNLFQISLRSKLENLPILVDLFLNENNISSTYTLEQISEMIWYLSFDHTGEHVNKPSRYCNISQSKLIRAVNCMTEKNKSLEVDVTTMLGVSNLSFYRDFRKSFQMFKNAKKQFDHWQLQNFKPKDFKAVVSSKGNSNEVERLASSDLLYNVKVDYNIKFLCNSVLLLAVNSGNEEMISQDLTNIFKKIEPEILIKYPEIWQFVLIKLNYHKMLNEQMIAMLLQEYLKHHRTYGTNNYFVLDVLINNTQKVKTLVSLIENLKIENLDDNNISHLISKFYKFAKNQNNDIDIETYNCLDTARELYANTKFKSSRLNSSHLLGEAIFSPEDTFKRYNSINDHFKITQLSISSLFVSVYKLYESNKYDQVRWGVNNDVEPLDFALAEFNKHISRAYGDTSDGMLYPNDNLLTIYINVLKVFGKVEEIKQLLPRLVDLKYPLGVTLFNTYLDALNDWDRRELLRCLNAYDMKFNKLISSQSEYQLKQLKGQLPAVQAKGSLEEFVSRLEFNWGIIRRWDWPGRH